MAVAFYGAGYIGKGINIGGIKHNNIVNCQYSFGSEKGGFSTPTTIIFNHTGSLKSLNLNCKTTFKLEGGLLVKPTLYTGTITDSVETSFDANRIVRAVGRIGDRRRTRIPQPPRAYEVRKNLVESRGVQLLPSTMVISPTVYPKKK